MKLTNPTDQELDAAFAEHVAGWRERQTFDMWPAFTRSMDAVLPYLAECDSWNMEYDQGEGRELTVDVWRPMHGRFVGDGTSLPRAVVIAILSAHGITVEFTE